MKSSRIRVIIFLSLLAVLGVIVNQYYRVQHSIDVQHKTIEIQKENALIERAQFDNKVTLALIGVRDDLLSLNAEVSGLYLEPVKQITKNYFVVSFYDTLNPKMLQNVLVERFEEYNVSEAFEYGIYDCFTDSIIYDKFVDLSSGTVQTSSSQGVAPQQKWNHDGHYFGVYFPYKEDVDVEEKDIISQEMVWSTVLLIVILLIFSVAIFIILKQKRLSEVKTDFINNMTHELKTPIATIALSSDVLRNMKSFDDGKRIKTYAEIIHTENRRLESQVERVLQLAKLDKGKIQLKKESIDVIDLIKQSVTTFRLTIEQKNGTLDTAFPDKSIKIFADRVHITNVIYNLMDNATKYSPGSPEIGLNLKESQNGITIAVSDKGKGMTKDQSRQVFEKFYRVPTGSVHDVKGFGLGLYYVKEIVNAHNGKVSVDSSLNEGSVFTIYLPFN